jgi:hypothetical protein
MCTPGANPKNVWRRLVRLRAMQVAGAHSLVNSRTRHPQIS